MNKKFHSQIISIYGDRGQKWLDSLPDLVQIIASKYMLSGLKES
jgi:hypothetical protein